MAMFTEAALRSRAQRDLYSAYAGKRASDILLQESRSFSDARSYDIFLSHSFRDAELILGLRNELVDLDFSVYVDWIEDPTFDRSNITPETAAQLRRRMRRCASLLYAVTEGAIDSRWMPWELGYFDAFKGRVAVLPVRQDATPTDVYHGREYLGLYPYVTKNKISGTMTDALWVHASRASYVLAKNWLTGMNPTPRV